ncbi:DNA replication/repair protein RecF [Candidatus Oleimmundimicrobium sp.]|uniref:DNA replication/repair protein RecF n=1 Tax=Candidatus Oleimmundimicrobium sp. TaxID=3060597 RepID=UPI002725C936|nr:DNA replication/repair protein RecF [Candidatus Oleimmundimicrobium sp.]MDO8886378.1 DNA replication/repair protein RecF [Candidatus Oleimmundimicrobium sp.]
MYLQDLKLLNFRNHKKTSLKFFLGVNLITGKNGQGKTNLLEAIYVLLAGKSHRTALNDPLIMLGEKLSLVKGTLSGQRKKESVEVIFKSGEARVIKINGAHNQKVKDLRNLINVVLFSPEDLKITKGSPDKRRAFLDEVGEQINPTYNHLRWNYLRVLKQRNELLKKVAIKKQKKESLDLWDEKLSSAGSNFILIRKEIVEKIKPYCSRAYSGINSGKLFTVDYLNDLKDGEDVKNNFLRKIEEMREKEIIYGNTLVGPHKDDLKLCVEGMDIRLYGSQGEQRMASLSLKLAELELIQKEKKRSPLLLMDDVLSELDEERRQALLRVVLNLKQSIITSTNPEYFNYENTEKINTIEVLGGSVKETVCLKA